MNHLAKIRQQFALVLGVLGLVDLLLIIYLLLPGTSASGKAAQEKSLMAQQTALTSEVRPLRGIGTKLGQTRVDIKTFYEQKVPSQFSQISQHLEKLTQEAGVSTMGIHYNEDKNSNNEKNALPNIHRINIDTTVTGEYAKVARFINAMEQDKFIFIIDQISLSSQESGVISLQIKFQTFLKDS
jgi:type IV pilus assembly protein PilO